MKKDKQTIVLVHKLLKSGFPPQIGALNASQVLSGKEGKNRRPFIFSLLAFSIRNCSQFASSYRQPNNLTILA
jgi:hypothetical protein